LDVRLGIVATRMTPALAEVTVNTGRLAAYLPQQAARDLLAERFSVTPSVEAYRRVVADLASQVRAVHDEEAVKQLLEVIQGVLQGAGPEVLELRYVTDAGCHPQAYYRNVLCKMKHPLTNRRLKWTCAWISFTLVNTFRSSPRRCSAVEPTRPTSGPRNNGTPCVTKRMGSRK